MQSFNWHLLQLFGDTGSAADTITGEMAADAGQQDRANHEPRDAAGETLDHAALARAVEEEGAAPEKENAPGSQSVPSRFVGHIRGLELQAAALQRQVPDFDLRRELENPVFVRLTAPGSGLTVEDAYFAVHRARLQSAAVETAARKISNSIRSGSYRPKENGTVAQAASVAAFDYRNATAQQRAELKQRIREAAARGEKLYPGR